MDLIRDFRPSDAEAICNIYNYYILQTHHTFETEVINEEEIVDRIKNIQKSYPFIVYENNNEVWAYAYANRWKARRAYDQTVESTIYVKKEKQGKGVGSKLYTELLKRLKRLDIHCVLGGISLPNDSSIYLHEKLGFKKSGVLREVGYKFEKRIDVGYWTLIM